MKSSLATLAVLVIILPAAPVFPQATFDVISLDGSAKVQRVSKKEYEKISVGSQVHDNDIVETYFQAKLVMQFGKGNVAILGSNSKALLNIREQKADNGTTTLEVNLTLFSGGCFVKAISNCRISVYTSNAVGETENGSFSTVVESKTGETGFQELGGSMKTRNIAQKEGSPLSSGQTNMILPGKEPTAPLYITMRHVTVLKHFFGDDYIDAELSAAGIKPTEEKAGGGQAGSLAAPSQQYSGFGAMGGYKKQFVENRLWASILSDRAKDALSFSPSGPPDVSADHKIVVQELNSFAMARGGVFPAFSLVPSFSSKVFSAGLRIPFAANYTGQPGLHDFGGMPGFLDLVDHVTIGPFFDSTFVKLGPINDYTIGGGIVVDGYNNYNPYIIFHPLGVTAQVQIGDFSARGFLGDLTSFSPGGLYVAFDPTSYHLGVGIFFDGNQNYLKGLDSAGFRLVKLPSADSTTDTLPSAMSATIYQIDISTDLFSTYDLHLSIGAGFAQKLAGGGDDGFVLRVPIVGAQWSNFSLGTNITTEGGRLVEGEFNSFYMSNRARVVFDSGSARDTLVSQNSILGGDRLCSKLELFFGVAPIRGLSLSLEYKQNLFSKYSIVTDTNYSDPDLTIGFSLIANDTMFRPLRYGKVYLEETHGGLYPHNTVFPSWGFKAGIDVVTNPIILGIGLSAGFSWYYLDMNSNNKIDAADNVVEFYLGLRYGFL